MKNYNFSNAFPSAVNTIESWFSDKFPGKTHGNYSHISPLVVAIYDLLLSLKRSCEHKSAMSCSVITRALFEARVNFAEITRDPNRFSEQFTRFKEVAKFWNEFSNNLIDQNTLISQIKIYPEWYDSSWKKMKAKRKSWTGIENDTISAMANIRSHLLKKQKIFIEIRELL